MRARKAKASIEVAWRHLNDIEDAKGLLRERLTLSDYWAAMELMPELAEPNSKALTFSKSVADFFHRYGFSVTPDAEGVNFVVGTNC